MVWPPPKVLATPEGDVTVERPHGGSPERSAVVPGVQHHPRDGEHAPAAPFPGATVSVMAATSVPRDWLERPEGLIGCVLGSRYRITNIIGRGPMGIACEGESSRGRQVTLKLLPRAPELPVEHFAWQVRQALALAHFDHHNVAPISDFGSLEDGSAFVSRARVPGVTLRTILRQGGLPIARALDIARQIAAALATAHVQDIAHGRLKPENVVVQGGARGADVVKVIDFGMAGLPVDLRAVAPNEAEARRLALRTRLYLPADVTGASPAVDVYSLGVLLFEMIAGQPPFAPEALSPSGPQQAPLGFAQCNPALVVPASVNELVFGLLHPGAAEHGLSAERVGQMLDAVLGRPSVAPPIEPVTAQVQTTQLPAAQPPERRARQEQDGSRGEPLPPPLSARNAPSFAPPSASSLVWPTSPAPAPQRPHSFPPLPQGFASSHPPTGGEPAYGAASYPSPATPPPRSGATGSYPTPPSQRRPPSRVDEPFATPSFPPAPIVIPQAPPAPSIAMPPSSPAEGGDELDMDLRPSFIGRLKRLFGKKRPSEF